MCRASVIARVAALVGMCAVGAPVAIATASAGAVSGIESRPVPLSTIPDSTTSPMTPVSGPVVRTSASERATVRAGGSAAVAATSTAHGFLGIATELNTIPTLAGLATDPDTPFVNLLRNLSPGAPLLLRLGGNSGDDSWWPVPGEKERYLYTLTPRWGAAVRALLTALGGRAILGLNLEAGSKIAGAEVTDFDRYVGANLIDAFELGNEPEFYSWTQVGRRGRSHDPTAAYDKRFAYYGKVFSRTDSALGGAPLAGPGTGSTNWLPRLGTVLCSATCPT